MAGYHMASPADLGLDIFADLHTFRASRMEPAAFRGIYRGGNFSLKQYPLNIPPGDGG